MTLKRNRPCPPALNARTKAAQDLVSWLKSEKLNLSSRVVFQNDAAYGFYRHLIACAVRHYRRFQFYIESLSRKSLQNLDVEAIACLLIGLVQLDQGSQVSEYAAVNETVNLVRQLKKPYLKGFINANLRSFIRNRKKLDHELAGQSLEIRTSHPDWLVSRWRNQFGADRTIRICEGNNELPVVKLVVNGDFDLERIASDLENQGYHLADKHAAGFTVCNPNGLFANRWMTEGALLVQDASSQMVNQLVRSIPKSTVFDACAAPGGKLFHLEWDYKNEIDLLVGADYAANRIVRLVQNKQRLGSQARIMVMNAEHPALRKQFDLVVADVPCSATGTIQKHPEIKWNRQLSDFETNARLQMAILEGLKDLVGREKHLLYVTCSLESEENQDVVRHFLMQNRHEFRLKPFSLESVDASLLTPEGYFQCLPDRNQMGLFAALFQRNK